MFALKVAITNNPTPIIGQYIVARKSVPNAEWRHPRHQPQPCAWSVVAPLPVRSVITGNGLLNIILNCWHIRTWGGFEGDVPISTRYTPCASSDQPWLVRFVMAMKECLLHRDSSFLKSFVSLSLVSWRWTSNEMKQHLSQTVNNEINVGELNWNLSF